MNLPNRLTIFRIILAFVIITILLFPFDATGIEVPRLFINEMIVINFKYIISGMLFILASLTDLVDGYLARKYNMVTDFGKMMDAIADKVLVNSVLIILTANGFVHPLVTVVIVIRDIIVDSIKMTAGNNGKVVQASMLGKAKTVCLMVGISLTLFYNLPFELWNLKVSDFLLILAAVLSLVSAFHYYYENHDLIFKTKKTKTI